MNKNEQGRAAFTQAYASLNAAQKKAVDTIDGPVMVIAGPGTGKTQILTLRIANILKETDTAPDSILALTFTESGAKAMRDRLRRYLGSEAYQVGIYTFHGFAQSLIGQYPDAYSRIIGGRPATDLEKISLIEQILDGGTAPMLRPAGHTTYYVTPVMRMISSLKQENVTPDKLHELIGEQEKQLADTPKIHEKGAHKGKVRGEYTTLEKSIDKNRGLLAVYRAYQALLSQERLYDFDDMIFETVRALESDEDMQRDLQERFQYVLADEHQDVNGAQNKILQLLADFHEKPNIFAVGDEKQAIYRFQGASLENFLHFTTTFADTQVISLTENYRSGQPVLDTAHELIKVDEGPLAELRLPLNAAAHEKAVIEQRNFLHQAVEDEWVVRAVQKKLEAGVSACDIAVIVRTNKEVELLAEALRVSGIPVAPSAEGDVLRHPVTRQVRSLISAIANPGDEMALFTVLHGVYWNIATSDLVKALKARSYEHTLAEIISDESLLKNAGIQNIASVTNVHEVLTRARMESMTKAPHHVLANTLQASGLLDHLMTYSPLDGTRVVRRLYDEIEALVVQDGAVSLASVATQFTTREAYGLPLHAPYISAQSDAVQVMTAHKSKGLEFDTVIIPHLTDAVWSGAGKRTNFKIPLSLQADAAPHDILEDERRLLYVALTRAKQTLLLSHSETNTAGKELTTSRFLESLDDTQCEYVKTDAVEKEFSVTDKLAKTHTSQHVDTTLLANSLQERGFSATSLNNFLRSPWDYVYRNVLRIPEPQTLPLQFGTAVHNVLEVCTREHTSTTKLPSDTAIKQLLERELQKMPLSTEDFTQLLEKGLDALYAYVPYMSTVLPEKTKEELKISVTLETGITELPELTLTGKLDRVDIAQDGTALRVIDYKTGKPKSRNVIEGKTKDSNGGYKRQLVFYALLLELHNDERYQTRDGVLSFVEPNAKGEIREEVFTVTDEEVAALKSEIIDAAQEILSGDFLTHPPTEQESDYWQLAAQLIQEK